MQQKRVLPLIALLAVLAAGAALEKRNDGKDYPYIAFDHPAIKYSGETDNPVSRLQEKIDHGQVRLAYDPKWGYLPSLLKQLDINIDSQMLVFSKTSFQGPKISPRQPRAVYFNDNVGVGFVQSGDVMEFTALDPKQGVVFYTMNREKTAKPFFVRRYTECLNCHVFSGTLNIPGLVATSVIPDGNGKPRFVAAATVVDSRTPIDQRWGGWYVTGTSGNIQHRGNSIAPDPDHPTDFDLTNNQNLTSLDSRFDTSAYLGKGSDIVALMTLEHQTRITDLLIRLGWETRVAEQEGKQAEFGPRLDFLTDEVVAYMLFVDEAHMDSPIAGVSTFTKTFPERGPRDKQGRSLRDFDLQTRLFRYPLSYMIYSPQFDALPDIAKDHVYKKLFNVLTGQDKDERYSHLKPADLKAVLEIVRETKPGLPAYWQQTTAEK